MMSFWEQETNMKEFILHLLTVILTNVIVFTGVCLAFSLLILPSNVEHLLIIMNLSGSIARWSELRASVIRFYDRMLTEPHDSTVGL